MSNVDAANKPDRDAYISPLAGSEAAPGIAVVAAEAVNRKETRDLYAGRQKIYARRAKGLFRNIKWIVMILTLGIYYVLPWLRWNRGPHLPDQAVLLDFPTRRFFFFFLEIWPQEFYYVTGLLVLASLALFLITSVAGRVWCGYTCPQTVWTDLMIAVERFWQGDRNQRMRLDKEPWGANKIFRKVMTHLSWLLIALATGGAFVFYFDDAPKLARELVTGNAPAIAYMFIGIFAGTTYLLGGIAREQVCIYMCPWPRIQGAMFDRDSLLITYHDRRGEPRGPHKKGQPWEGRGDCIDCKACVAVCPMGIDIRDGSQLECIQCALCIDACNDIMKKVGRPKNLITYDTFRNLDAVEHGQRARLQLIRPRTILYTALMAVVGVIMLAALSQRALLEVNVLADRNPLFVTLSDGSVRNGYTVKILNKRYETRHFLLRVEGLPGASVRVLEFEAANASIDVVPDDLRALKVYVTVPPVEAAKLKRGSTSFSFVVRDKDLGAETRRATTFRSPER
ncbi:MAG: cytochrome c oxidase accessory protein CcoG [Hyphomicrobiaceae bacterium]